MIGEQLSVVAKEAAKNPRNGPNELTMGQAQKQTVAEVLPQQQCAFLGARRAKREALAGEGSEDVVAAVWAVNSGDALAPLAAQAEGRGGAGDKRKAEPAESAGIKEF